jgi:hypothetical protein
MFAYLADVSIRSLLLAASAIAVLAISRNRRSAALEHAVWTAVVCGMLALFALGRALPRLPLRVLTSPAATPVQSTPLLWKAPLTEAPAELSVQMQTNVQHSINWSDVVIYAYAAIDFAFLARFITGMFLVRRLPAASKPAGAGFLESGVIAVPLTVGCFRPQILFSSGLARMGPREVGRGAGPRRRPRPPPGRTGGRARGDQPLPLLVPSFGVDSGAKAQSPRRACV